MMLNNVEILTMDEWYYIDDEGEVEKLETSKSTLDVVRVYKNNSYLEVPLEHPITFIPGCGSFLFDSERIAKRYQYSATNPYGLMTILSNSLEGSRHNSPMIIEFNEDVKLENNGLFCIPNFDELISEKCWLRDIHYINNDNEIKTPIPTTEKEDYYIAKYLKMINFENKYDFNNYRVLFEIYHENNKVYVGIVLINYSKESFDLLYITRMNEYRIYASKNAALWAKENNIQIIDNIHDKTMKNIRFIKYYQRKRKIKNIGMMIFDKSDFIINMVKDIKKQPPENKILKFLWDKIDVIITILKMVIPIATASA